MIKFKRINWPLTAIRTHDPQLSLNVLLVMDCVTARCGSQVQPTKMTLARQRVLSSSEVRASDLEHGGSWVRIPSVAQIFSVFSYG